MHRGPRDDRVRAGGHSTQPWPRTARAGLHRKHCLWTTLQTIQQSTDSFYLYKDNPTSSCTSRQIALNLKRLVIDHNTITRTLLKNRAI